MNVGIFRKCPAGKFDSKGECLGKILYEAEVLAQHKLHCSSSPFKIETWNVSAKPHWK